MADNLHVSNLQSQIITVDKLHVSTLVSEIISPDTLPCQQPQSLRSSRLTRFHVSTPVSKIISPDNLPCQHPQFLRSSRLILFHVSIPSFWDHLAWQSWWSTLASILCTTPSQLLKGTGYQRLLWCPWGVVGPRRMEYSLLGATVSGLVFSPVWLQRSDEGELISTALWLPLGLKCEVSRMPK